MKKHILHISVLAAVLSVTASCVYPIDIDVTGAGGSMVIEGDIFIGEITDVKLSYSSPLNSLALPTTDIPAEVEVVDDQGMVYPGYPADNEGLYKVDTRNASPDRQYKLRVRNLDNHRSYESTFQRVCRSSDIDSLSYIIDEKRSCMNIAISMHSGSESWFKWSYVEDWEYHTIYQAQLKYTPPEIVSWGWYRAPSGPGTMERSLPPDNNYYCWSHDVSTEIMIFSTENQSDDRFVDLEFHTLQRWDRKISYVYRIKVQLEPMGSDAYAYWDNVRKNSDYNGSLFSPNPSEMPGNITCIEDPDEFVIGYINAAERSVKTLYVYNSDHQFYKEKEWFDTDKIQPSSSEWYESYQNGYLPYYTEVPGDFGNAYWVQRRCIDCTQFGGKPQRPDDWETN